jgi:chorismate mutase/prephenate dehydratase
MPQPPAADRHRSQQAIDAIDRQILELVERRCVLVRRVCEGDGGPLVGRVAEAAQRIEAIVRAGADAGDAIEAADKAALLRHLSSLCLQSLHQLRVAYLGPSHSYSHLAAIKYFGDAATLLPVASIPAVFEAVARADASAGIVPIENSTDGRVVDTLGMFVRRDMQVCGEVLLPIHHNLLSKTPREEITEVYSKPQALSQCRGWLSSQLPKARLVEISSTAAAAKLASEKQGVAAVASIEAGRQYGLDVIDANIEDNPNNVTRFAVLGREQLPPTGDDKTAILFQVCHQPGALADAMTVFKSYSLNLTWIESFPAPEAQNEYLFFVELAGHREDPPVRAAIDTLERVTQRLTILGSYPRAARV